MEIVFVLVEPAVPENIGAAARALKTMGFSRLRLVKPQNHLAEEARWLAHGSNDILESANIYESFNDSIKDIDFIIGTTAKKRSAKADYYYPEKAKNILEEKVTIISKAAIIFGKEESGLTNEQLRRCDIVSTIPIQNPFPSINLAQSVMLYAYVFSALGLDQHSDKEKNKSNQEGIYSQLRVSAMEIFKRLDLKQNDNLYGRMLERIASASQDDIKLMLSFIKKFRQKFD